MAHVQKKARGVKTKVGVEGVPMLENPMTGENAYFQRE